MQSDLPFDDADIPRQNYADCPDIGIYHDIPFEDYAAWRAINSGVVKWGQISPKHMHAAFNGLLKSDDTRSMKLGRAIHAMLLEPETFAQRFIVAGPCEAVLKSGERKGLPCGRQASMLGVDDQWYCGTHAIEERGWTGDIITADEKARCDAVNEAIKSHWAVKLIRRKGWSEVSLRWERSGLPMKGRLDRYAVGTRPVILDVKKCRVGYGTIEKCEYAIRDYAYHVQAAMYVDGTEQLTGVRPEFIWIFVEDNQPFDVQILPASEETLKVGWHIARTTIDRYARAVADNELYGYIRIPENIKPGGLPIRELQEAQKAGWFDGE
jgi:exodeoxyribonuclease VIII